MFRRADTGRSLGFPGHPYLLNSHTRETHYLIKQDKKFLRKQCSSFTSGLYMDITLFLNMPLVNHTLSSNYPHKRECERGDGKIGLLLSVNYNYFQYLYLKHMNNDQKQKHLVKTSHREE